LAIIAVLVDHNFCLLYTNPAISRATFFNVSLFVLLSGITAFYTTTVVRGGASLKTIGVLESFWGNMLLQHLFYKYGIQGFLTCKPI